jgi:hypothetical protein
MDLLKNKKIKKAVEDGSFIDFKKYITSVLNEDKSNDDNPYSDSKLLYMFNKLRSKLDLNSVGILNDDKIKGGLSDKLLILDIVKKHFKDSFTKENIKDILDQLKMGIDVEMEHTDDPSVAFEIAMDHLSEMPDYYSKLSTIEEKFASKAQAKYFYAKANEKGKEGKKWKKMADEFASETDFSKLPEKVKKKKVEERLIAWMPDSSTVDVKDECRLGGGKICNQGDINAVNIRKIKK